MSENPNDSMNPIEPMETIEVDITDDDFLFLAKLAHKKDITFNQLINELLKEKLEQDKEEILPDYPSSSDPLPSTQKNLYSATQNS